MATDMVTSPAPPWELGSTPSSSVSWWLLSGSLEVFPRVMYSILIVNTFVPILDRYIKPKIFGEGAKR